MCYWDSLQNRHSQDKDFVSHLVKTKYMTSLHSLDTEKIKETPRKLRPKKELVSEARVLTIMTHASCHSKAYNNQQGNSWARWFDTSLNSSKTRTWKFGENTHDSMAHNSKRENRDQRD